VPADRWQPCSHLRRPGLQLSAVLHRQGRCRQDLAVDRRRADAGRCRQESIAGQHRCRVEPRRDAGHRAAQHTGARARCTGPVGAEHRPRQRCRVLPPARSGADGAGASAEELSTVREQLSGACTTEIASFDEFSSLLPTAPLATTTTSSSTRRPPGTPAAAQPAQGLDRVSGRQRPRCLLPGAAFGLEDAGGALQGRAGRLERSGQDHRDPGDPARQGCDCRSGAHLGRVARAGLEQPAPGDQRRVPCQRAQRRGGLRHRGLGQQALDGMPQSLRALPQDRVPLRAFDTVGLPALRAC
jgi:hypothetical protein